MGKRVLTESGCCVLAALGITTVTAGLFIADSIIVTLAGIMLVMSAVEGELL